MIWLYTRSLFIPNALTCPSDSASGRVAPWCTASDDLLNGTDDTADEIMERIVRSATQGPGQRTQPRERRRSRVNRKSRESGHLLDKRPNLSSRANWNNAVTVTQIDESVFSSLLVLRVTSCRRSKEDAEERFDDRGGKRSRLVQWFWDAVVKWTWRHLEAPSMPQMATISAPACCDELSSSFFCFWFVWFVSGLLKRVEFIYELTGQGQQRSTAFDFYFCWINVDDLHSQGLITVILQKRLRKQNTNAKIYFVTLGNVSSCQVVCFSLSGLDRILRAPSVVLTLNFPLFGVLVLGF